MKKAILAALVTGAFTVPAIGHAQTASPEGNLLGNGNVTKLEIPLGDGSLRVMQNPAQTRVRLQDVQIQGTDTGRVNVRIKDGNLSDPSSLGDLSDVRLNTKSNGNVAKVTGTIGDVDVKGISTPGTTNITVKPPK
jgi:hypothetical protein